MSQQPITFDRFIRILGGVLLAALILYVIHSLSRVLLPFLVALLIAYLLNPLVLFFQKKVKLKKRGLAVIVTLLVCGGVFTGLTTIMLPVIKTEMNQLTTLLTEYVDGAKVDEYLPEFVGDEIRDLIHTDQIQEMLTVENGEKLAKNILPSIFDFLSSSMQFLMGLLGLIIILMYLIFIMMDYDKLTKGAPLLIPEKFRSKTMFLFTDLEEGMNKYFRAQALKASIIGVLFAIGFSISGLPMGFLLGLGFGALNMVPYLQLIGIGPALFLALLQSLETGSPLWIPITGVLVVLVIVQLIDEMVLTPKIMGEVTGLNPAIIMLSLSIWGSLLGMVGLIIALPITSLLLSYYQRFLNHKDIFSDED